MVKIDYKKCCWRDGKCTSCSCGNGSKCEGCVEVCPTGALERQDLVVFLSDKCVECEACVLACKYNAITSM